jgi:sugar phosphate isomerase/epimerase
MLSRRSFMATPLVLVAARAVSAQPGKMSLAIHTNTSSAAGYRGALEGWAKAGITQVEISSAIVEAFLKTDTLQAARRILTDNGLKPVSGTVGGGPLLEPSPDHTAAFDGLKRRLEMFAALGLKKVYTTTNGTQKLTLDDYKVVVEQMRRVGDMAKQFDMIAMVEFVRASPYMSTLPTALKYTREAAHPNFAPMFDFYHFWSGNNKLEDLDLIRPGEIQHVHFQDVPDMPRELLDNNTRVIPGDGVSPLLAILKKLAEKGYAGPLSVELFSPKFRDGDPFAIATEIRRKAETVMRAAGVA